MKILFLSSVLILFLFLGACEKATDPDGGADSSITAKEKLNDVLQKARLDFAADARLSAIYGWNVGLSGEVDLLRTDNAFVYVVQSDQLGRNEFYVPVFAAGPVKSPVNFTTMLSLVNDSTAGEILGKVLNRLSTLVIDPNADYNDSPATIQTALSNGGNTFISQNSGVKVDMFLLPGKSIDTTLAINNSADWIVNFYSNSRSLVLWIKSSGEVTRLSN